MSYYKIWDYVTGESFHPIHEPPKGINFKTGLDIKLHPERTFVLGEMQQVIWYASYDGINFTIPVVRESFTYDRDPVSHFANERIHEIEWYLDDETIGPDSKIVTKYYNTIQEKRSEVARKRYNQTSKAGEVAIGALIYGVGMAPEDAVSAGQTYWASLAPEITEYEQGNTQPLLDRLESDTDPAWVPAVKDAVIAELD